MKKDLVVFKGLKFNKMLQVEFEKIVNNEQVLRTVHFNSKIIINKNYISGLLETSQEEIVTVVDSWLSEGSGWTTTAIITHLLNITNTNL